MTYKNSEKRPVTKEGCLNQLGRPVKGCCPALLLLVDHPISASPALRGAVPQLPPQSLGR